MDFESAYQRYKDGVASAEEKDFVEKELEKARKMTEIIDAYESKKAISEEYDEEKIRKAKKQYAKKNTLKILLISTLVLIVSAVIVLSAVFGTAFGAANKNCNYSQTQAEQIALDYLKPYADGNVMSIAESKREMEYSSDLKNSHYVYEVKVCIVLVCNIELRINAKTGEIIGFEIEN